MCIPLCTTVVHNSAWSTHTHTHTRLTALFPGLPGWAGTRKVNPIWILLKQETVRGSGISWAICKSAPRSRQITTPAPHNSVFYRPDALPAARPTASKHWRHRAVLILFLLYHQTITIAQMLVIGVQAGGNEKHARLQQSLPTAKDITSLRSGHVHTSTVRRRS